MCKAIPLQAWTGPEGSRRSRLPYFKSIGIWRWQDCQPYTLVTFTPRKYFWHGKVVSRTHWSPLPPANISGMARLSALHTGHLYPQQIFLALISVSGWVDPRVIVQPEGLCQWIIPVTPSGIKPVTSRLVAKCLNRLCHCVPRTDVFLRQYMIEYAVKYWTPLACTTWKMLSNVGTYRHIFICTYQ
jgi:hypothetical protein